MNAILPKRLPKASKRSSRWRSQSHCSFVRSHQCCVPDCSDMPIEVAHVRIGSGAGMARKPDDFLSISLCRFHHAEQHRVGERTFEARYGIDMTALADAFARQSPKWFEIEQVKRERGL